jgi:putative ABC transport system permease protein
LIFTITVNERKQEWGVLRVLGSTRQFLLSHILREGQLIALAGGIFGFLVSLFIGNFFINQIAQRVNLPLGNPPLKIYVGLFILSLLIALLSVTLASLYPVWLVNRQDPAVVLRG